MTTLVVFDIDGTLLDSAPAHQCAYAAALETFEFDEIDTNWGSYREHTDSWIFREIFRRNHGALPSRLELETFDTRLHALFTEAVRDEAPDEVPGALELVERLRRDPRFAVAFATGGMRRVTREKLKMIATDADEGLAATATEHALRSHIVLDAIDRAARSYGAAAFDRVVSVGDGLWDVRVAHELGLEFIGIAPSCERFAGLCPDENVAGDMDGLDLARDYAIAWRTDRRTSSSPALPPPRECWCWDDAHHDADEGGSYSGAAAASS